MIYGSHKTLGILCKIEYDIRVFVQKKMSFAFSLLIIILSLYLYLYFSYKINILAGIASITLCHCTDGRVLLAS